MMYRTAKLSPLRPMVILTGESRSSPGFIDPDWLNQSGFSFELVPDMARAIRPIRD